MTIRRLQPVLLSNAVILKQIDEVLARVKVLAQNTHADHSNMSDNAAAEAVSLMKSTIERLVPHNSSYLKNAQLAQVSSHFPPAVNPLIGVLNALRFEYANDYLRTVQELIHADMFGDFLAMSEHLLEEGYKDPAAVLVGSVLEEHLRKLAIKNGIGILKPDGLPKKADSINSEMASASAYSMLDQKSVTAWLDLRNKAAHGKYAEYAKEQVSLMIQGIQNFLARLPA